MEKEGYGVIIAGSRGFTDYEAMKELCDALLQDISERKTVTIISGGARGADTLGERYARERGYGVQRFPADWKRYGRSAGMIRNGEMAKAAKALIAFWDGQSPGTGNMIRTARRQGLDVHVVETGDNRE